jgi:hypothetical protein
MYRKALKASTINLGAYHKLYVIVFPHPYGTKISLRHIQVALSHNSSKTAKIYTRVLAMYNKTIKSPLGTMYESVSLDENKTTS